MKKEKTKQEIKRIKKIIKGNKMNVKMIKYIPSCSRLPTFDKNNKLIN